PPIAIGIASLGLLLFQYATVRRTRALSIAVALLGSVWVLHDVARGAVSPTHETRLLVTADVVRDRLRQPRLDGSPLPDDYRCGENPERFGIKFNGSGWASTGDCSVDPGSMFFFSSVECLRVHVAPFDGQPPLTSAQTDAVRAKVGLVPL